MVSLDQKEVNVVRKYLKIMDKLWKDATLLREQQLQGLLKKVNYKKVLSSKF